MADPVRDILAASLAEPKDAALDVMRLSMLDWIAVGYAGREEPVVRVMREMVLAEGGSAQATLFGGGRAPARGAALVNGAASHALDYDDTHFAHIGHPSVAVIPAALALAERDGGTALGRVLGAALAGCEASIRFGLLFGRDHYQRGFHQTATAGAFGATVASMSLLAGPGRGMDHALGLCATRASGVKAQFGTMGKPYNAGIAASNGVECALMAAHGFEANPGAITGPLGFLATHHCDGGVEQPDGFLMTDVSHKFHACCHGLHASLEALGSLGLPGSVDGVSRIVVETHPRWIGVCDKPAPRTGLEAKFSYAAVLAFALLEHDTGDLATYEDALVQSAPVQDLMARVEVVARNDLSETQARVSVWQGQARRQAHYDLSAPQTLDAREARVRAKAATLLGRARAAAVWQSLQDPEAPLCDLTGLMV